MNAEICMLILLKYVRNAAIDTFVVEDAGQDLTMFMGRLHHMIFTAQ